MTQTTTAIPYLIVTGEKWSRFPYWMSEEECDYLNNENSAPTRKDAMMTVERYAHAKWFVYQSDQNGEYPRCVGHIIGGNQKYLGECGPHTLGYFTSKKQAVQAIEQYINR